MRGMTPDDVYELTGATDPRLSPDGRLVAFTVSGVEREANEYRGAIWLAPTDRSRPPARFTAGTKRDAAPRWSADGNWIAFLSNRDGDHMQLYLIPVEGGEPRRLTDLEEDVTDPVWSPDGTRIAFTARVRDPAYGEEDEKKRTPRRFTRLSHKADNVGWIGDRRQHVFTVAVDGSEPAVQVTEGDHDDAQPSWAPDGTRIAFVSARHDDWDIDQVTDVHVVAADGGDPTRLTPGDGSCEAPSWSPDGSLIAYRFVPGVLDMPRHGRIAVVPAGGGSPRILTSDLDRTAAPYPPMREPIWDGGEILFAVEDGGSIHLYRVASDASTPPTLALGGERGLSGYDLANGRLAFSASGPNRLDEVHVDDRPLTGVGRRFSDSRDLQAPERFVAISKDGTEVEAWILRPAGSREGARYPVLLNVHGGPFTQYGNRFFDEFQVYAGAGYAVVYSNPRGSSGYGEAWGRAIKGGDAGPGWGTLDFEDVMAVIDTALDRFDFCDPDRVGVLGGSYGGFLTSWIVSHTDRFRAACTERALNHWVSFWGSSDIGGHFAKSYFGSYLFEDLESHVRYSPATYAQDIHTPLLILHSENDLRCPVEQAEHLFTTLRVLKRRVELVRFPAEGHELSRSGSPRHRVQRFEVILEWFDRHLKD